MILRSALARTLIEQSADQRSRFDILRYHSRSGSLNALLSGPKAFTPLVFFEAELRCRDLRDCYRACASLNNHTLREALPFALVVYGAPRRQHHNRFVRVIVRRRR